MNRQPTVVDLFCGAGGFSLGFQKAGFRIIAGVDHDELSGETYSRNFSELQPTSPPLVFAGDAGDLTTFDFSQIPAPDVLIGGPPCQAWSRAGRAKLASLSERGFAEDPRNELYLAFIAAIRTWHPLAFVMENVPGMLSVEGHNAANDIAEDLADCGYDVRYALLNAAWYGVPQLRERLIFVGYRRDLGLIPTFPSPDHRPETLAGYIHREEDVPLAFEFMRDRRIFVDTRLADLPPISVEEALHDLPPITEHLESGAAASRGVFRSVRRFEMEPRSRYARLMRAWTGFPEVKEIDDHAVRRTPRDFPTFRVMNEGDRYPEAVRIAWQRADVELRHAREAGEDVSPGSDAYLEIVRRHVPPYGSAWDRSDSASWNRDFPDRWRKLMRNQPSWTIPAHLSKDSYSHIHYDSEQARMISVREAARLQSFPDAFRFAGNMGECFRQIGNAVPPLLAHAIALQVRPPVGHLHHRSVIDPIMRDQANSKI
jgi:DNA (cytosine-5)-methyltransferase 1